jgi:Zn-dependent alcohol dehydrogenase
MVKAWREGKYPSDELIKTYPAREMEKAAHDTHNGTTTKAVFVWD